MKKILSVVMLVCTMLCLFFFSANAECAKEYYIPRANGKIPELPKEESDILKYGGYYRDTNLTAESAEKKIYLTFDMGYVNENALSVIETLREKNVPATFFILDHVVKENAELLKRLKSDGHIIGNHTTNHKDMTKCTSEEMKKNLTTLETNYKEATGKDLDKFFRFPEGKYSEKCLKTANELGYKTIFWSFAYADWDNKRQPDAKTSMEKILSNTHNGEIILLHPTSKTNAKILPKLIEEWKKQGYTFATVDSL